MNESFFPSAMFMPLRRCFFIAAGICLLFYCAHQTSPTGGPDDRTGPTVMAASPAPGAVNVNPHSRCTITFSEWISKTSAPKSVSILPPLDGGAKISITGRRIEIRPNKVFADSTTYHIVLTATLQDLHGNPLNASYTLVFSTGPGLDSGKVAGCVVGLPKQQFLPTVALFRDTSGAGDSLLFHDPEYLTQADSSAFFSIDNIRPKAYRIVAFIDQDGNHRLNPGAEPAFAPLRRVIFAVPQPDTVRLFPVETDTASPGLDSARPVSSKIVVCKLSRPLDTARGWSDAAWKLERFDRAGNAPAVKERLWLGSNVRCALFLADTLSLVPYRMIGTFLTRNGISIHDTVRFNGITLRDTIQPALLSYTPHGSIPLMPEIRLHFTEPVTAALKLALIDSLRDTVRLNANAGYSDTIILAPQRRLHAGSRYRFLLMKTAVRDMIGNPCKARDSTDTVATAVFSVISVDSLAVSLSGCAACLGADAKRKWQFIPLSGGKPFICMDSGGCYRFDSLPAARGFVGYFTDNNNNGRPDPGSLLPWTAPEPFIMFPDTIEARARWEIEGSAFSRPCGGQCMPHRQPVTQTDNKKKLRGK